MSLERKGARSDAPQLDTVPSHGTGITLRSARDAAEQLYRMAPSGFFTVDLDRRITSWNNQAQVITGFSEDEAVGQPCSLFASSPCSERCSVFSAEISKPMVGVSCTVITKAGEQRILSKNADLLRDKQGNVIGAIECFEDVTEQRKAVDALRESEARFRELFHNGSDATFLHPIAADSLPDHFIEVNDIACRMLGRTREEILASSPLDILGENQISTIRQGLAQMEAGGRANFELTLHTGGDLPIPVEINARVFLLNGERVVMSVARDITERRLAEAALQEANEKLIGWVDELESRNRESALVGEMGDLLQTCTTFEDAYSVVAHSMPQLFPDTSGALYVISASRNLADAACSWGDLPESERFFAPEECWGLRRGRAHVVEDASSGLLCRHIHEPLGGGYLCMPMVAQGEALGDFHLRSSDGPILEAVRRLAVTVADHVGLALANLRLRQTLRDQAVHDQLTGLFNRRYMEEMLDREISRAVRRQSPVGIIMADVDHFKRFNDIFGHEAGDVLLSALGHYLRGHVRDEDIACRYGGEELVLILPDADLKSTERRATELLEGIRGIVVEHRHRHLGQVTISMGVAAFPMHGRNGADVLRAADLALYRAKAAGRDRVNTASVIDPASSLTAGTEAAP